MTSLFRPEAIAAAGEFKFGRPIALLPPSWRVLTGFFAIMAVALLVFLATATFARKETVPGILTLSHGELRVMPTRPGVVKAIYVQDGQLVAAGDALVLISTEQQLAGGGVYDARVLDAIAREQSMLEARLAALAAAAPLDQRALSERLAGLRHQAAGLAQELPGRLERARLAKLTADAGQTLFARGVMTGAEARQRRADFLAQDQAVTDLRVQIAQLDAQAAETAASLAKLPADTAQSRASIQQEIVALEEKRASADAQTGFVLRAAGAGRVTALQANPGQPADPAKPLLTLVPEGSALQAEIYVPSRAIGFVRPGQRVRLLYDAFPHERFGAAYGAITLISAAVLRPDEANTPVPLREPAYRIAVRPDRASVSAYGAEVPLIAGMALSADIILEERSFLDLLLDPIRAARGRILGRA